MQTLTFTGTIKTNPFTGEQLAVSWSPAQQFTTVVTPGIAGFYPNLTEIAGQTVDHNSTDRNYVVKYNRPGTPEQPGQPGNQPLPGEKPGTALPSTPANASAGANDKLPQTGSNQSAALTIVGLVGSLLGLLGLKKRRHD